MIIQTKTADDNILLYVVRGVSGLSDRMRSKNGEDAVGGARKYEGCTGTGCAMSIATNRGPTSARHNGHRVLGSKRPRHCG